MRSRYVLLATLVLAVMLAGCRGQPEQEQIASATSTPIPLTATPLPPTNTPVPPTATPVPPTATSAPPTEMVAPTATREPETGAAATISGKLTYGDTGKPLEQGKLVRLVQVDQAEGKTVLVFGGVNDPMAETQADGSFLIPGVPPGRYAVVVHNVGGSMFVPLKSTSGDLIIIAFDEGGQEIDLGEIPVLVR